MQKVKKRVVVFGSLFALVLFCLSLFVPLSPTRSILKTVGFVVTGRLHLPTDRIGKAVTDKHGNTFTIFREVIVDPARDQPPEPRAVLILHFRVTNMTPEQNKLYSLLPLPLYIGDPGFRSKLFTIHGEHCHSIYEWDTADDARNYLNSMALRSILVRAVPDSLSFKIIEK
jgi:hypothetical protein